MKKIVPEPEAEEVEPEMDEVLGTHQSYGSNDNESCHNKPNSFPKHIG